ncbi:MAG TPA: thioredoxin family protein [Steroidobacteraceae bacterium]|nr:thioredoxin family protein [Steroidobacteraceae bacterium]
MAARESRMLALGTPAPDFALPDPAGKRFALRDFAGSKGLLVAFICNHCPYVKHILDGFVQFAREYGPKGIAIVAINSNDPAAYPEDDAQSMARIAAEKGFTFPYLIDETQAVAKAYQAICTPDFFLFDVGRTPAVPGGLLAYRGQFDGSRPRNALPVTGSDLRAAADALLAGKLLANQIPSIGCSIKWKSGQAPDWA